MSGPSKNTDTGVGTSLAMFGAVAMLMTRWQRQASSAEDLGSGPEHYFFFDPEEEDLEHFVRSVPKIELHVHLDGSFDAYQMWSYLKKHPELIHCFPVEKKMPWAKNGEPPLPLK